MRWAVHCIHPRAIITPTTRLTDHHCFVQIYIGAPNIIEFSPGPHSFIHAKDFSSPHDMATYVNAFLEDNARYQQMFEWKSLGLSPLFKLHLDNCVHYTECKVCEMVHKRRQQALGR